jgi:NAD(P)-dependent dehydrogenase (short-subunit alcohol dehydrogenase family)
MIPSDRELNEGILLLNKLEQMEDIWKESKQNQLLLEFLKKCHVLVKNKKPEKQPKAQKPVEITSQKEPVDTRSKFLKSIGGSSKLQLSELPSIGECMDTVDDNIVTVDVLENMVINGDVIGEHLQGLKTSTSISEYNVSQYSQKIVRHCVVCGGEYSEPHKLYHQFCGSCAELNYLKRTQIIWIPDRIALVTGSRIKIGYEISLKLLQSGCKVIGTTRFPKDALRRFCLEPDFEDWKKNLLLFAVDFRDLNSVSKFIEHLKTEVDHLDILVNNAAQTVRKPPEFYQHLIKGEMIDTSEIVKNQSLLQTFTSSAPLLITNSNEHHTSLVTDTTLPASVLMSQVRLLPEEDKSQKHYFPSGQYDYFGQQVDKRPENSWIMKASQVSPIEMLECQIINAVVPFMLVSQLRPMMEKSPNKDRYILNVSAMEGTFYRYKTSNHPHTNMAKASLNMLTRTSAIDYASSGIFMTSIDTGWVTDERPHGFLAKKNHNAPPPPLDELDGAMRVLDPCFMGIRDKEYHYGVLFKDYCVSRW